MLKNIDKKQKEVLKHYPLQEHIKNNQQDNPIKVAIDMHTRLLDIHPFLDGNGRTARLLMNLILQINKYSIAVIKEDERIEYFDALETAYLKKDKTKIDSIVVNAIDRSLDELLKYFKK